MALLRGINVGGHGKLPMRDLRELLTASGLVNVRTYIQSGNVVFECDETAPTSLAERIQSVVEEAAGFAPRVVVFDKTRFLDAVNLNPFPEAEPKTVNVTFMAHPPADPDLDRLGRLKNGSERYQLIESCFYLHAPDGIGRSKLAAAIESSLGVPGTSRNGRSLAKIAEMT